MDKIHVPDQARLRPPREISDDQEGQSELIPFHGEPHRREINLLWALRFPASFYPKALQSKDSLSLPFVNTQLTSRSLPTQNPPANPLRSILQNPPVNRRHMRADQTIKSIETRNGNAEAVPEDSGAGAQTLLGNIGDSRTASHEKCKKELSDILEPIHGSSLFLCWGNHRRCHVLPVTIPNSADDVAKWQAIRRAWYAQRGEWRQYLPLFGVKKVDIVKVCRIQSVDEIGCTMLLTDISRFLLLYRSRKVRCRS